MYSITWLVLGQNFHFISFMYIVVLIEIKEKMINNFWRKDAMKLCITVTTCEADLNLRSDTIMQYGDVWPTVTYEGSLNDSFGHIRLTALIWGLYICTGRNVTVQLTVEYGSAIFAEKSCIIPVFLFTKFLFFSCIFLWPSWEHWISNPAQ